MSGNKGHTLQSRDVVGFESVESMQSWMSVNQDKAGAGVELFSPNTQVQRGGHRERMRDWKTDRDRGRDRGKEREREREREREMHTNTDTQTHRYTHARTNSSIKVPVISPPRTPKTLTTLKSPVTSTQFHSL
jgi:hypothetical protein